MKVKLTKRILCVVLAAMFIFALGACGSSSETGGGNYEAPIPQEENTQNIGSLMATAADDDIYCRAFNDGYAFCTINSNCYIINVKGEICGTTAFDPVDNDLVVPVFHNGVALVCTGKKYDPRNYIAIDTTGAIIVSPYDGDITAVLGISDEGQVLVSKREEAFDGVKSYIGLINKDGSWAQPLKELEFMRGTGESIDQWAVKYCGDGIFLLSGYKIDTGDIEEFDWAIGGYSGYFYDADTGNIAKNSLSNGSGGAKYFGSTVHWDKFKSHKTDGLRFINGKAVTLLCNSHKDKIAVVLSKDGTYRIIKENLKSMNFDIGSYNGELFFMNDRYYSTDGSVKIDLSDLNITYASPFVNDIAIIRMKNDAGTTYATAIDKQGKMLFEPMQLTGGWADENGWLKGGYAGPGDPVGTALDKFITEDKTDGIFVNEESNRYVDKDGNILFVNVTE